MPHFPAGWNVVRTLPNAQMVWNRSAVSEVKRRIEDLNISHIDEMLALTELNKLGRFRKRAPELGSYIGIHESGQLVAVAGERISFPVKNEKSDVCPKTPHPRRGNTRPLVTSFI